MPRASRFVLQIKKKRRFKEMKMKIMSKKFLMEKYNIDISENDLIIGYRADDSYFRFAEDFLNNSISVEKLERAKDINKASVGTEKNIAETLGCNIEEII